MCEVNHSFSDPLEKAINQLKNYSFIISSIEGGPISGPSVVVHVGEDDEPPQVNGGESSSVSKSNLKDFIDFNFDG